MCWWRGPSILNKMRVLLGKVREEMEVQQVQRPRDLTGRSPSPARLKEAERLFNLMRAQPAACPPRSLCCKESDRLITEAGSHGLDSRRNGVHGEDPSDPGWGSR